MRIKAASKTTIYFLVILILSIPELKMIKSDKWIIQRAKEGMIAPFAQKQVRTGISFGTSSYGYDFRISNEFKVFRGNVLDPKKTNKEDFEDLKTDILEIPPNSFVIGKTVEYFKIPENVITICFGKSTYARCGIIVNVTPFEPGWEGYATISITNSSNKPVRIYANEGIAQLLFLEADERCETSYADKKGKYQAQKRITLAKI